MTFPENNIPKPSRAQLTHDLEIINRKIEVADGNENTIERSQALDVLGEDRDWLIAEIADLPFQDDE